MKVIIPMSGIGKRFIDAGYDTPKPLIPVDGIPMIQHVVDLFPGADEFVFICNKPHLNNTSMRDILSSVTSKPYTIVPIDSHKKGPVYAVLKASECITDDEEVIISYCDYGTNWSYDDFVQDIRVNNAAGSIAAYKGFHPHMLGSDNYAFIKDHDRNMIAIQEKKPFTDNRMEEYASNGTYYFSKGSYVKEYFQKLIDNDINVKGEYYVSMVYNLMVEDSLLIRVFPIIHMLQWGTPYDLEIYNNWSHYFNECKGSETILSNPPGTTTLVPMAGYGSRFSKVGYTIPKPFLDVSNKPMVVQATDCLPQSDRYVFVSQSEHNAPSVMRDYIPTSEFVEIAEVTEGQACTCEVGINEAKIDSDKPLLITACDNASYYDFNMYKELLEDETIDVIVWTFNKNPTSKNKPDQYSWIERDGNKFISAHVKSCPFDNPYEENAIIGTFFFRKARHFTEGLESMYEQNIRTNGEFYVDNLLNCLPAHLNVRIFPVIHYICWGMPDEYETYNYWKEYFTS